METITEKEKKITGLFSQKFYYAFRALFNPITQILMRLGVSPNVITFISIIMGAGAGINLAMDRLWAGLVFGYLMSFSDIVDGQLAHAYGRTTKFGGILDSTIDRYNEFFIYTGLGVRYYFLGKPVWSLICASVFLGSVMVSYIKARAEADGFECNVGKFQRPERLTILAIGIAFRGMWLYSAIAILAIFTQVTVLHRIIHVYRQSK